MPMTSSPEAFADVRDYLDRALDTERGVRVVCETAGGAVNLRQRLYRWRAIDRKQNAELYPKGDVMHGRSVYDALIVVLEDVNVDIKKVNGNVREVTEL